MNRIIMDFQTCGLNALATRASEACRELIQALPWDATGEVEAPKFLRSQELQCRSYFQGCPQ